MADLLSGAAVGAVFGELLKAVLDVIDKARMFSSTLDRIKNTLESIILVVEETDRYNKILDRKDEARQALEHIKEGKKLVVECSRIRWYNVWKRVSCTNKLLDLEDTLKQYYQIVVSAQTKRDTSEILNRLQELGQEFQGKNVGGGSCAVPAAPENPVGFEIALNDLKMEVFKEGVSMVVVSAPPGIGKTTLVKLFCHDKQVKDKFKDNIFYVIVSRKATLEGIVQSLYHCKSWQMPEFRSEEHVAYHLEQFLNKIGPSPILLILDDVWPESESILDKFKIRIPDYKIVVTSRSEFPGLGSTFKLKPLNNDQSMILFRNSALPEQSSNIPDDIVMKIVKCCKGFPLALTLVGKSLRGKTEEIWRTREKALSKGSESSIFDYKDLLKCLQSSLDALDKDLMKQCFMDLCSFPEDTKIPVTSLIDLWVELYKLDEDNVVTNLYELVSRNLIDLVVTRKDASGSYNQYFVMQHDLLRELALHQSNSEIIEQKTRLVVEISGNNFPDWWMERKYHSISAHLLSLSTDEKFSSNWSDLYAPEVEALVLNFQSKNYTFPEFLKKMEKLKTLIATNYAFFSTEFSNFPLLGSLPNLKRIRLENVSIPSCAFSSTKFSNLQKITVFLCRVGQAFSPSSVQVSEALPNLQELSIEYCNDLVELPDGICQLNKLRKLSITNCHSLSALHEEIGKLVNLEVLNLNSCIELTELPDTIGRLNKLNTLDISECLEIEALPKQIGELQSLKKLNMMGCSRRCDLPESIVSLENLQEVICDYETSRLWEPFTQSLKNLRIKIKKEDINLNWLL